MDVQYVSDNQGKTTGVIISITDWEKFKNTFESFLEPTKEELLEEIKQAVKEVNLIKQGKMKAPSFEEFINEL